VTVIYITLWAFRHSALGQMPQMATASFVETNRSRQNRGCVKSRLNRIALRDLAQASPAPDPSLPT